METVMILLYLVGGTLVLSGGAHLFVSSASHIAKRFGIPSVVIGLTVVAFGTSAPEMAVSALASWKGNAGIAMGNVVGSNIFNICIILGICAIIMPLSVNMQLLKIDIPIMVIASIILFPMVFNYRISRLEAGLLFLGIIAYTILQIKLSMKERLKVKEEFEKEYSEKGKPLKDTFILIFGLGLLVVGADFFVTGAVKGARLLGWSEAIIGLTIIAAGTSLPEVATSIAATLKGERDIAIGNVVGSNIFNILTVLGISGLIAPLHVDPHIARIDVPVMIGVSALMIPFTLRSQRLGRFIGIIFVAFWIGYTTYLILKAS